MKTGWPIVLAGLFGLGLLGCDSRREAQSAVPLPVPVEVVRVEERSVPLEVSAVGTVEPIASVQLKPKVSGEIQSVGFQDGAYVKAGQPLFTIDSRSYEAAYKRAAANRVIAESRERNADQQLRRYTMLSDKGVASAEQFALITATAEAQKAEVEARQSDLDEAKLSLDWTTVRAPIDGRAGAALAKVGNIVQANTQVLAIINQVKPIYVAFSLPEALLGEIRRRMAEHDLVVTAFDPESHGVIETGRLTFFDNTIDRDTGMVVLRATFENSAESLWPGQFVDIKVKLAEQSDALVIPTAAVLEGQAGSQVFVVEGDVALLRRIEVERADGPLSVIRSGLAAGELVITSGQLRLTSGAKVAPKEAPSRADVAESDAQPAVLQN